MPNCVIELHEHGTPTSNCVDSHDNREYGVPSEFLTRDSDQVKDFLQEFNILKTDLLNLLDYGIKIYFYNELKILSIWRDYETNDQKLLITILTNPNDPERNHKLSLFDDWWSTQSAKMLSNIFIETEEYAV